MLLRMSHENTLFSWGSHIHGKVFATFLCLCSHWWFSAAVKPPFLTAVVLKILPSYIKKRISLCVRLNILHSVWQDSHINFLSQLYKYPRITLDLILTVLSIAFFNLPPSPLFYLSLSQPVGRCWDLWKYVPAISLFPLLFHMDEKKEREIFVHFLHWRSWLHILIKVDF